MQKPNYKLRTIVIAIVPVSCVAVVIAAAYLAYRLWRRNRKVNGRVRYLFQSSIRLIGDTSMGEAPLQTLAVLCQCLGLGLAWVG